MISEFRAVPAQPDAVAPAVPADVSAARQPIRILASDVADRIAAGEVIERPTSVVRELLDNALDAGAREIGVEMRGGGLELIRVADDGRGIPPDEVEVAFMPHATSKLRDFDDLYALLTLGFRGEALPSIAAVAEVAMLTRDAERESGTMVVVRAGEVLRWARAARRLGTTVTVRHLFHNVPTRLKFLASSRTETMLATQLVRRYALARPEVRFTLVLDGHTAFRSTGSGDQLRALGDVYGPTAADAMLALGATKSGEATIDGYVGGRALTRPGRQHVHFVINGRCAISRGLMAALETAYRAHLPRGRHPIALIRLDLPAGEVDPNVHPAKTEVRLLNEEALGAALAARVRDLLGQTPTRPTEPDELLPVATQYHLPAPRRRIAEPAGPEYGEPLADRLRNARVLTQVHGTLIVAETPGGVLLVDQHRAHERAIYEQLVRHRGVEPLEAQSLIEPAVLELTPRQAETLADRLGFLAELGISCERFGGREYLVRSVPSLPSGESLASHLQGLLEEAAEEDEGWRERLLISLSCRSAVRRGRALAESDMRRLLVDLADTVAPASCPHGSPLVLELSGRFLERQFGW